MFQQVRPEYQETLSLIVEDQQPPTSLIRKIAETFIIALIGQVCRKSLVATLYISILKQRYVIGPSKLLPSDQNVQTCLHWSQPSSCLMHLAQMLETNQMLEIKTIPPHSVLYHSVQTQFDFPTQHLVSPYLNLLWSMPCLDHIFLDCLIQQPT